MCEINVKVDKEEVLNRFKKIQKEAGKVKIAPVVKNNANGLLMENMIKLLAEDAKYVACAYVSEFNKFPDTMFNKNGEVVSKIGWHWTPGKHIFEIEDNIGDFILVCKTLNQIQFCIDNNIRFFIEFNVAMNRGGFRPEEVPTKLKKILYENNIKEINVFTHCPYEDDELIDKYVNNLVPELLLVLQNSGFEIGLMSIANSAVYRWAVKNNALDKLGDIARLGEEILLPKVDDRFGEVYDPIEVSSYALTDSYLVHDGETVGYNTVNITEETNVIVVPVGYYNFEGFNKVIVDGVGKCDVLTMMHDTLIVKVPLDVEVKEGTKVTLICADLLKDNWNKCIQRTCKFNKDLVVYI